jgi:integrase
VSYAASGISQKQLLTQLIPAAPERYRAIIATAAGAGLRWGEAAGLCLDAIDLPNRRLRVIRTVIEVSGHTAFKAYPKPDPQNRWWVRS